MPDDVEALQSRIQQLEDELAEVKAQADAQTINYEKLIENVDTRYTALATQHGADAAAIAKLTSDNTALQQELGKVKAESHKLQTALVEKDAKLERFSVQLDGSLSEKRALDRVLEAKEREVKELEKKISEQMDKIVKLTESRTETEASLKSGEVELQRARNQIVHLQQEKSLMERQLSRLNEEIERKSEQYQQQRHKAIDEIVELQGHLGRATAEVAQLQHQVDAITRSREQDRDNAQNCARELKDLKEFAAREKEQFEKELSTAQRLIELYKKGALESEQKASELEGIVRELRNHMEQANAAHRESLEKADAAREAAEKLAEDERQRCERIVAAVSSGNLPTLLSSAATPETPGPSSSPAPSIAVTPSSLQGMSHTELYSKYVDTYDKLRAQRLKVKQNEIVLEQLCSELEKKALIVQDQQAEYMQMKEAHSNMSAKYEALAAEKKMCEAEIAKLMAEMGRDKRLRSSLEQQLNDVSQQLAVVLEQNERLKTGRSSVRGGSSLAPSSVQLSAAQQVITQHLVTFNDIQGLVDQNQRLLKVSRDLAEEAERKREEAEEAVRAEYEVKLTELNGRITALVQTTDRQQSIMEQIVRQRNMYQQLYEQQGGGTPGGTATAQQGTPGQQQQQSDAQPGNKQQGVDYKLLLEDKEKELRLRIQEHKEFTDELRQQLSQVQADASAAQREATRAKAEMEFERTRTARLGEQIDEQRKQLEALMQSISRHQTLQTQLQKQVSEAHANSEQYRDEARRKAIRVSELEAEKSLLSAAHHKTMSEVEIYMKEKFRLSAELEASGKLHADRLDQLHGEHARLRQSMAQVEEDRVRLDKELGEQRRRADEALANITAERMRITEKTHQLERELKELRERASTAEQKAASAEAKVEVLQKVAHSAEQRAASLEMSMSSRARQVMEQQPQEAGTSQQAELSGELRMLRAERDKAQEDAAAATAHASQYKALAESSDKALQAMQAEHLKFKSESEQRVSAALADAEAARKQLEEAEEKLRGLQSVEVTFQEKEKELQEKFEEEKQQLEAKLSQTEADAQAVSAQLKTLNDDVERLQQQQKNTQIAYDRQVLEHGETVKRMAAAEKHAEEAAEQLREVTARAEESESTLNTRCLQLETEKVELQQQLEESKSKLSDMKDSYQQLNTHMEKLMTDMNEHIKSGAEGSNRLPSEVEDVINAANHYRKEYDRIQLEFEYVQAEKARLAKELDHARRSCQEAEERLTQELERNRTAVLAQDEHKALMTQIEQLHLVRDAHTGLKSNYDQAQKDLRGERDKASKSAEEVMTLRRQMVVLNAQKETHTRELQQLQAEVKRWQTRYEQHINRAKTVNLEEHQTLQHKFQEHEQKLTKVTAQLSEVEGQLKDTKAALAEKQTEIERLTAMNQKNGDKDAHIAQLERKLQSLQKNVNTSKKFMQIILGGPPFSVQRAEEFKARLQTSLARVTELEAKQKDYEALKGNLASSQEASGKLSEVENQLKGKTNELAELQAKHEKLNGSYKALEANFKTLEGSYSEAQRKLLAGEAQLQAERKSLSEITNQLETKSQELAACNKKVAEIEASNKKLRPMAARARHLQEYVKDLEQAQADLRLGVGLLFGQLEELSAKPKYELPPETKKPVVGKKAGARPSVSPAISPSPSPNLPPQAQQPAAPSPKPPTEAKPEATRPGAPSPAAAPITGKHAAPAGAKGTDMGAAATANKRKADAEEAARNLALEALAQAQKKARSEGGQPQGGDAISLSVGDTAQPIEPPVAQPAAAEPPAPAQQLQEAPKAAAKEAAAAAPEVIQLDDNQEGGIDYMQEEGEFVSLPEDVGEDAAQREEQQQQTETQINVRLIEGQAVAAEQEAVAAAEDTGSGGGGGSFLAASVEAAEEQGLEGVGGGAAPATDDVAEDMEDGELEGGEAGTEQQQQLFCAAAVHLPLSPLKEDKEDEEIPGDGDDVMEGSDLPDIASPSRTEGGEAGDKPTVSNMSAGDSGTAEQGTAVHGPAGAQSPTPGGRRVRQKIEFRPPTLPRGGGRTGRGGRMGGRGG